MKKELESPTSILKKFNFFSSLFSSNSGSYDSASLPYYQVENLIKERKRITDSPHTVVKIYTQNVLDNNFSPIDNSPEDELNQYRV